MAMQAHPFPERSREQIRRKSRTLRRREPVKERAAAQKAVPAAAQETAPGQVPGQEPAAIPAGIRIRPVQAARAELPRRQENSRETGGTVFIWKMHMQ